MSKIKFFFEDTEPVNINTKKLGNEVKSLINRELYKSGDISIVFCSDDYLLKINKQYLNHDYYTDIITFDYVKDEVISGDLFISIERIQENAQKYNVTKTEELLRVLFHGILHLIGYNDNSEEEIKLMRIKENYYLNNVDFGSLSK